MLVSDCVTNEPGSFPFGVWVEIGFWFTMVVVQFC